MGGPPGDAFKLVYGKTTKDVRRKMHAVDPTLCEMIRCRAQQTGEQLLCRGPCQLFRLFHSLHLYGDVYSSPGLQLRQKQLLMVAFLAEANMQEQLFGHLVAVIFHCSKTFMVIEVTRPCRLLSTAGHALWQ